ncbi:hypothetical protein [Albirhodobacter sp. R86504]|uniref:hypothetical protein n=1 Tax=Albirhodobacter sp. R86504 TaxID=3093848 RepID=UPI0036732ECD
MPFVRRLITFLAGNIVAQGLAAVTGLLLVRWLTVEQYAIYTIAISIMGAISVLAKGGANIGFVALLGRLWPDYARAGELVPALVHVRRLLMIFLMPLVLCLAAVILWRSGADWMQSGAILILLGAFWVVDLNSRIIDQILFFAHQTSRVQMLDSGLAIGRLAVVSALFAIGGLNAISAVFIGVLVALARIWPIRKWVFQIVPRVTTQPRAEDVEEIVSGVRRQLPVEAFYVSQAQIVLLLLAFKADATVIAGFGALMRISALLGPIRVVNAAFFVPIVARAKDSVIQKIFGLTALISIPGLILLAIAVVIPNALLWLLGENYAHLKSEIVVLAICVAFIQTGGEYWNMIAHRGWVEYSLAQIPLGFMWIGGAVLWLDLSTISGALILNAGFTVPAILIGTLEIIKHRKDNPKQP